MPILDNDLHGATVLECSLGELQAIVEELKRFWAAASCHQLEIMKAFSDLFLELTGETEKRAWLGRRLLVLQRQVAREQLPTYFWRPEADRPLVDMLKWRATFLLHRRRVLLDDCWDLLREFAADYAHAAIDDDELAGIIEAATAAEV